MLHVFMLHGSFQKKKNHPHLSFLLGQGRKLKMSPCPPLRVETESSHTTLSLTEGWAMSPGDLGAGGWHGA